MAIQDAKHPAPRRPDDARNRDEDMKPGRPPRPAPDPAGAESSSRTAKTMTDPATGAPNRRKPDPA